MPFIKVSFTLLFFVTFFVACIALDANRQAAAKTDLVFRPLVALLSADQSDAETQAHAAGVLADITVAKTEYAASVAREGGIPLLVALLTNGGTVTSRTLSSVVRSGAAAAPSPPAGQCGESR